MNDTDPPAPTPKRRTYWLCDSVTPLLRDRALQLAQKGFGIQFFTSFDAMADELAARRAAVVVVSDDGDDVIVQRTLIALTATPEVQGARLILVTSKTGSAADNLKQLAAAANFRDFLPANLEERQWLARFVYATASRPMSYVQPAGQIFLNNISAVAIPARITWISTTLLRLECRAKPPTGASLGLSGPLAEASGVSSISLKVVSTQRSHLQYRFSDAVIAEWSVPASCRERAQQAMAILATEDPGPRCRLFVAAQTQALRQEILTRFDDSLFDINAALQKQGLVDEPKFFTPDVVIIEDLLAREEDGRRFHQMMENLNPDVTVVVIGLLPELELWQKQHPDKKIVTIAALPSNLGQSVLSKFIPLKRRKVGPSWEEGAVNILADHPWSYGEITFPARLHRVHPLAAQVGLPVSLGSFALCRLESPLIRKLLGRNPWMKITGSYPDLNPSAGSFGHLAEGYLADVDLGERRLLAQGLGQLVADNLQRLDGSGVFPEPRERQGEVRTPELGSVRIDNQGPAAAAKAAAVASKPEIVGPMTAAVALLRSQAGLDEQGSAAVKLDVDVVHHAPPTLEASPIAELAEGIRQGVLKSVRSGKNREHFQVAVALASIAIGTILIIWFITAVVAPNWQPSGSQYSDQLKRFAPHLDRKQP